MTHVPARGALVPDLLKSRKMLTVQITPTRRCNIRCTHCFITDEHKRMKDVMPLDVFDKSLDICMDFASRTPLEEIEFVLMGGELHVLRAEVLRHVIHSTLDRSVGGCINAEGREITEMSTTVITNLIGITQPKLDIYVAAKDYFLDAWARQGPARAGHDLDYQVATSYEPDTNRFGYKGSYDEWVRNVRFLTERDIPMAVALTGTRGTIQAGAKKLIDFVVRDLGAAAMFDYFAPYGDGKFHADSLTPSYDELVAFMLEWVEYGWQISQEYGRQMVAPMVTDYKALENLNSRWLGIVSVDYDGGIYLDSESAADNQFAKSTITNVNDGPVEAVVAELVRQAQRKWVREYRQMLTYGCTDCRHVSYCQGGYLHFMDHATYAADGACPGLMPVMDRYAAKKAEIEGLAAG